MMWWDDSGWNASQWILMSLMMLIFWGGLIALVVWVVQSLRRGTTMPTPAPPRGGAEDILAERFARGEIDHAEYMQRMSALRSSL